MITIDTMESPGTCCLGQAMASVKFVFAGFHDSNDSNEAVDVHAGKVGVGVLND